MAIDRRKFLQNSGLIVAAGLAGVSPFSFSKNKDSEIMNNIPPAKFQLSYKPYTLELKHVFTIASSSRSTTPVMLTEIKYGDIIGYGEASMPPYLGESHDTVAKFLSKVDLSKFENPFDLEDILKYVQNIEPGNQAAKASVDIALHDIVGKLLNRPWYDIWGFNPATSPNTSFTIGIDEPEVVRQKVKEADEYKILKVKLGRDTDKMMIETIRSVTDKPLCVDINQGWKDKKMAVDMIHWLKEKGVIFIEQPMDKHDISGNAWITENSPIPIMGDEAVQGLADVMKAVGVYSGINIKLMKCGGIREAHKMLLVAKSFGMKVMIGCMTETSCAISAASHLAPMADWADLDGAVLISNDVFDGTKIVNGKVTLNNKPGIGVTKL